MAADNDSLLQRYALEVLYIGTGSADLTTNVVMRLEALKTTIPEMTARLKAMVVSAGGKN